MNVQDASEFVMNHIRRAADMGVRIVTGSMGVDWCHGHWILGQSKQGVCGMGAVALGRKSLKLEILPGETVSRTMAVTFDWVGGFADGFDHVEWLENHNLREDRADFGFGQAAGMMTRQLCWLEGIEVH